MEQGLWKYCTKEQCRQFLLSLDLTGSLCSSDEKRLALLYGLSNHAEKHYITHKIPKRAGGFRIIHEPDFPLKYVQRRILRNVLTQFSLPDCACAYRNGVPIKNNALAHVGKEKVLKLDIHDFFGNITFLSVYQHAFPGSLFPPAIRTLLTSLCCRNDVLPQGAPTSAYISNLVMQPFDRAIDKWCCQRNISYTRYCDDLTFSGNFDTHKLIRKVRPFLLRMGFELNDEKKRVFTRGTRQEVTGLTVNDKVQVPVSVRRRLRQEWYYIKKYGVENHLYRIYGDSASGVPLPDADHYLRSFAGRVNYILQTFPSDSHFSTIKEELKEYWACGNTDINRSSDEHTQSEKS